MYYVFITCMYFNLVQSCIGCCTISFKTIRCRDAKAVVGVVGAVTNVAGGYCVVVQTAAGPVTSWSCSIDSFESNQHLSVGGGIQTMT